MPTAGQTTPASVIGPGQHHEVVSLPVPNVTSTTALLRVQASGVCGTDVGLVADGLAAPTILGHHVTGVVEQAGDEFAARRGLRVGDQVVVEEYLPCGSCAACRVDDGYRFCAATDLFRGGRRVGLTPLAEPPGLWGGNAGHLHLPANAVVHRVVAPMPADEAVWTLPLANALDWTAGSRDLTAQSTVVVIGPGQHGLAAVAAARLVGAGRVIACGLDKDVDRLEIASRLGADRTASGPDDAVDTVREATDGRGADLVVVTAGEVSDALDMTARRGTVVVTSPGEASLDPGRLVREAVTVRGVRGRDPRWVREAMGWLEQRSTGLERIDSHVVGLGDAGATLAAMAAGKGPAAAHVVVDPTT